jgi:hypothetical protein
MFTGGDSRGRPAGVDEFMPVRHAMAASPLDTGPQHASELSDLQSGGAHLHVKAFSVTGRPEPPPVVILPSTREHKIVPSVGRTG